MLLGDSKTKENLMRAFAGESQARNRYDMAASVAKKEGFFIIEKAFIYTADQERAHAKLYYDKLKSFAGNNVNISEAGYPIDIYDQTLPLLKAASKNEYEEWGEVYKDFAKVANEEGFTDIATIFSQVAEIEKIHGDRFARFYEEIESGTLFRKSEDVQWMCTNCGHVHTGKEAPGVCSTCSHPRGYFLLFEHSLFE
ncbi:rubrerythrin [Clostridium cylindrosporum]|uniref:Rubrerythrin n=1 Tax=Clostridium cylindrosporum DSM 605 TaxID=1121307 RepID=A0A0J8D6X7_CLOCY|nr:rubrerythrin family protein [Clostridium cylindrosporum]KMT21622.1 rubrerythrin [Clostridium cylindrosporum DSM 605]